jgi:ribonuclease HI
LNVDEGAGAIGAILRNCQGEFVAASTKYIPHVSSAAMAEALAMNEGLCLAQNLGLSRIQAESNSMETIQACTGEEVWLTASAAIFADCIDTVASIGSVKFNCCLREANQTAHELARVCFSDKTSCNWVDEPPTFLLSKLISDVTIL